jgi:urease alpha subunit
MLAEGVGFEPTIPVKVCQFSRLVHSSTLPTLLYAMNSKANHLSDNTHFIGLCGKSAISASQ